MRVNLAPDDPRRPRSRPLRWQPRTIGFLLRIAVLAGALAIGAAAAYGARPVAIVLGGMLLVVGILGGVLYRGPSRWTEYRVGPLFAVAGVVVLLFIVAAGVVFVVEGLAGRL